MRIYFLGIAGTAMGNAALLLRDLGHEVMGSDQAVYPPMSDLLLDAGVDIMTGYDAERLQNLDVDLVVVGNAFSRGNVEVEFLLRSQSIEYVSLPELLSRTVLKNRKNIVVAGTHGKTTTTSVAAHLLIGSGVEPGYLIGGAPIDPPKGWSNGVVGSPFVIEGDEYDSAFFDKRSKFIHYRPHVAVVNNLEFDHADIFRDLRDVQRTFLHLLRIVPDNGYVLLNGDDENIEGLGAIDWTRVFTVGVGAGSDLRIVGYGTLAEGSRFELHWKGELWAKIEWGMTGLFNARNAAMASLAAALTVGGVDGVGGFGLEALERFGGVKRRQQVRVDRPGLRVIEDFGHHPTAIKETLEAFRSRYPDTNIVAAFEPRSNTSRLEKMRGPMTEALSCADAVVIGAAKATQLGGVHLMNTQSMADDLARGGCDAVAVEENSEAFERLVEKVEAAEAKGEDLLVVIFTNGSFGGMIGKFVDWAEGC